MNAELPPFKNGEHNSGSASTCHAVAIGYLMHQFAHGSFRCFLLIIRCIRVLGFFATESAKLFKSATEKRDLTKHLLPLVAVCDQKHANRIPRPKVGVSIVV